MKRAALIVGVAGVGLLAVYLWRQRQAGESIGGAAGRTAATFAFDTAAGVVKGIGAAVGIPNTDAGKCEADLARGDMLAASFSCPAPRFVRGAYNNAFIHDAAVLDARQIDRITERAAAGTPDLGTVIDPATGWATAAYDPLGNRIH